MVDAINTSFIPKKTVSSNKKGEAKSVDLILLLSVLVFAVAIVASVGVFIYKNYLDNKIGESKIMLEREKNNFDITSIEKLSRLDQRLMVAEELLNNHVDLIPFFQLLQENTLKNVQFETFNFSANGEGVEVLMKGVARSYSTVALQSDVFGEIPHIHNPIFSDLDVNNKGDITFNFSASIDGNFLLYKNNIN